MLFKFNLYRYTMAREKRDLEALAESAGRAHVEVGLGLYKLNSVDP